MQVPTDFRIIPNPSEFQAVEKCNVDTRSAEATPLYKIDKLQSIFGGHSNLTCSILESCSVSQYRKGQGCLRHVVTKFWSLNRRQGGGKYTHRAQFLELFESFWFYRDRRLQKPNLQKIRTIKTVKLWSFVKGSQEVFETVSNQSEILSIFPSVYLFASLSLSLSTSYLSIDYIITISKMWFKCCPKPQ